MHVQGRGSLMQKGEEEEASRMKVLILKAENMVSESCSTRNLEEEWMERLQWILSTQDKLTTQKKYLNLLNFV